MTALLTLLMYIVSFLLVISAVVVVHELGHYLAGRMFNAASESFSVGFGKSIAERTDKRGTRWRLNWLPLGGFVKFVGEQDPSDSGHEPDIPGGRPLVGRKYNELSVGERSVILLAGPFANFVLSTVVFGVLVFWLGIQTHRVVVTEVQADSAAAVAGFEPGDQFLRIDGREIRQVGNVLERVSLSSNTRIEVEVLRDGDTVLLTPTPRRVERKDDFGVTRQLGLLGVGLSRQVTETNRVNPIEALGSGAVETWRHLDRTFTVLGRLFVGKEDLSLFNGPIGMAKVVGEGTNMIVSNEEVTTLQKVRGLTIWFLTTVAAISVAVGFFNLLPIPVLDGGHLVMNLYEAVTGRLPSEQIQAAVMSVGLVLLGGLFLFITFNDIISTGLLEVFGGL